MVIRGISKRLNSTVEGFLVTVFMKIDFLVLQCVEIPLHRRIVIRTSGFAHALCYAVLCTEFCERFGCIRTALIAVQYQLLAYVPLAVQCLFKRTDRKITCHAAIRYACNHAAVMQVKNRAIISDIASHAKQIGEIGQPFLIDCFCCKILTDQVLEMRMLYASLIFGRFSLHNRAQAEFLVHVLMNRCSRKMYTLAPQIDAHPAITDTPLMCMVDGYDLLLYVLFFLLLRCIFMLSVVVIGIWINIQTPKQPTNTEPLFIFVDEPICL